MTGILVRKFAATEPTWGSWGSESSGSSFTGSSLSNWSISNSGTLTFNNLTISQTPYSQSNFSATVNSDLTVNSGQTLEPTGGTITMAGTSKSIYNYGTSTFYNLTVNDSASINSYGSFTTTGNLTINSSSSLEAFGGISINNWTRSDVDTAANDQEISSIIYVNSKYVAAGGENNGDDYDAVVWETADLTSAWTKRDVDTGTYDQWINSIIYDSAHSKYVAAGEDYNATDADAVVWESPDLISWTQRNVDTGTYSQIIFSIIYDSTNSKYVTAGEHGNGTDDDAVVWESPDLISWTQRNVDTGTYDQRIWEIIYVNSKYVAAGYDGNGTNDDAVVWETADLTAVWTQRDVDTGTYDQSINSIIYDSANSKYVAAGEDYNATDADAVVWESTALTSWTQRDVDTEAEWQIINSIIYDSARSKYVAAGYDFDNVLGGSNAVVWEATDLTSWTQRNVDIGAGDQSISSIIYDSTNSKYVAAGYDWDGDYSDAVVWESNKDYYIWVEGDFSNSGTFTSDSASDASTITAEGNVSGSGIINITVGSFEQTVDGTTKTFGTTSGSNNWIFNHLIFSNFNSSTGATIDTNTGGSGTITINGDLLVSTTGDSQSTTLQAGNRTWILANADGENPFDLDQASGVLTAETSTFSYTGDSDSGNVTVEDATYNNINFGGSTAETYTPEDNLTVTGNLTIDANGTLDVSVSSNLTDWIQRNVDIETENQGISSIIYVNLKYVAAGYDDNGLDDDAVVWESTDLISWTQRDVDTGADDQYISSIIYDSTHLKYVAAGYHGNGDDYDAVVWESTDLISWTQRDVDTAANDQGISSIIYVNLKYVAAGYDDNGDDYDAVVWETADLTSAWTQRDVDTAANDQEIYSIIYDSTNSKYVAAGYDYSGDDDYASVWETADLTTAWTQRLVGGGEEIYSIIYDSTNEKYVAAGDEWNADDDAVVWESTDLISWTQRNVDTGIDDQEIYSIIYDSTNSKYVAAGYHENETEDDEAVVWESTDLISWTQRDVDTATNNQYIYSIIYDSTNSKYVVAGRAYAGGDYDAVIWESTIFWTQRNVDTGTSDQEIKSIIYVNSKYVAAGVDYNAFNDDNDAVVWESANLISWTQRDVDTGTYDQSIYSIIYVNSKYVAVGYDYNISDSDAVVWESPDLISWTQRNVDTGVNYQWINSIIYDSTNLKYVAAGDDNDDAVVWESPDLISWTQRNVDTGANEQEIYFHHLRLYKLKIRGCRV